MSCTRCAEASGLCKECEEFLLDPMHPANKGLARMPKQPPARPFFTDHDYHAHDNDRDRAIWNSIKPTRKL